MKANDIHVWRGNVVLINGLGRFGSFRPDSDLAHVVQTVCCFQKLAWKAAQHHMEGVERETCFSTFWSQQNVRSQKGPLDKLSSLTLSPVVAWNGVFRQNVQGANELFRGNKKSSGDVGKTAIGGFKFPVLQPQNIFSPQPEMTVMYNFYIVVWTYIVREFIEQNWNM